MKILTIILFLILIVLQYRLWIGEGSFAHVARLKQDIAAQREENKRLAAENSLLAAEVKALKVGSEAIETRAREDLGLIKEGETFYLILDKETNDQKH